MAYQVRYKLVLSGLPTCVFVCFHAVFLLEVWSGRLIYQVYRVGATVVFICTRGGARFSVDELYFWCVMFLVYRCGHQYLLGTGHAQG